MYSSEEIEKLFEKCIESKESWTTLPDGSLYKDFSGRHAKGPPKLDLGIKQFDSTSMQLMPTDPDDKDEDQTREKKKWIRYYKPYPELGIDVAIYLERDGNEEQLICLRAFPYTEEYVQHGKAIDVFVTKLLEKAIVVKK